MTKDMTTGNPVKLIVYFSIPLLIGNIFQQFYSMVDTIIVGRFLGTSSLAALGATGAMMFLIIGFATGLTSGFSVIAAQFFGANDAEGVKRSVATSITLSIISTIVITIISVLLVEPLLNSMNTPADIMQDAKSYITIIFAGTFATVFYNMISSILRALGDSRTPLYFLIVSSILNIVLDLLFIVNFSMGVSGAAYATVISQGVSGLLCLIYAIKKYDILKIEKRHFKMDKSFILKHFKIGLPMAFQFSITAIGVMVLQSSINSFGSVVVAAHTAASKVEQLVMQPSITFGITMATYSAQNLGAGKIQRIKDGVKKCSIVSLIVSIVCGLVVVFFGDSFTRLFIKGASSDVIRYSQQYLNTVAIFFPILGLLFIYRSSLQGIGDAFVPMMAGAAELVARVIVSLTLPLLIGYTAICLASPLAWIAATIPLALAYFKRINSLVEKKY